jgi:hypothetical protein
MTSTIVAGAAASTKPLPTHAVVLRGHRAGRPAKPRQPVSREAQRVAAAILEVLAGGRTPTDAAVALGIAVPRYYLWEQRALEGLVAACEPRPVGQAVSERHQIAVLQKEVARLKQDCARQQALVRAAQRTIRLTPPAPKSTIKAHGKATGKAVGKKARQRRPVVRALKAAAALRTASTAENVGDSPGVPFPEVLQPNAAGKNPLPPAHPLPAVMAADA